MSEGATGTAGKIMLPRTESEIMAAAGAQGFRIPDACMPGVAANLALLATHADCLLKGSRQS